MSQSAIILMLSICIIVLLGVILYQHMIFRSGIHKTLHQMSSDLEKILEEERDGKIMVFTDRHAVIDLASQINRLLEAWQKRKVETRRYELASKKMLSNISHDIKTPMTVILGYLEIMRLGGKEQPEMFGKVEQKAKQVVKLINEFFTLAKLESGDVDMELSKLYANELCRESILDFYGPLTQKEFQIEIEIPDEDIYVYGNKEAMERILFNLISNVIRYGSDGKYLGIRLWEEKQNVFISIVDKGKGIEKEFADTVFERLFTMEDSRNKEIQGNGLGLTIAKNLAKGMGGELSLESEPFVQTVFMITLKKYPFFQ